MNKITQIFKVASVVLALSFLSINVSKAQNSTTSNSAVNSPSTNETVNPTFIESNANFFFTLTEDNVCTITIADINGNTIKTLCSNTFFAAGANSLSIDGIDDIPPGPLYVVLWVKGYVKPIKAIKK